MSCETFLEKAWHLARQCEAQGLMRFTVVDERRPFVLQHQSAVDRVCRSVKGSTAGCVTLNNVHIAFDEMSLLCPDAAIWSREPDEQTTPVTLLPEAVVEVLHTDSADKDLLACGCQITI